MQAVKRGGGRRSRRSGVVSNALDEFYSCRMSMYDVPPINEISMEEFETLAIARVKLLKAVEEAGVSHNSKHSPEYKRAMYDCTRKYMPLHAQSEEEMMRERRADHISHFILRLAYCRTN